MTNPTVCSEPPSARMCSGSRKNEANVMKKKKFATATRRKLPDTRLDRAAEVTRQSDRR
jgi:hypothetical protein